MAQLNTLDCETGNASIEIQALKLRESYLALILSYRKHEKNNLALPIFLGYFCSLGCDLN